MELSFFSPSLHSRHEFTLFVVFFSFFPLSFYILRTRKNTEISSAWKTFYTSEESAPVVFTLVYIPPYCTYCIKETHCTLSLGSAEVLAHHRFEIHGYAHNPTIPHRKKSAVCSTHLYIYVYTVFSSRSRFKTNFSRCTYRKSRCRASGVACRLC